MKYLLFTVALVALTANAQFKDSNIEMVHVQGGTFTMGCANTPQSDEDKFYGRETENECFDNETPAHKVTLSSFYIGKYEVTQAQWFAIMGENPSYFKNPKRPVEKVFFEDIVGKSGKVLYTEKGVSYHSDGFCGKLYQKTGKKYRLPTEAEWEFAARGGNESSGYKYSGSNDIDKVAWYEKNSGDQTHPVGQKQPNELGIYDMSGNVWEWCSDWYGAYSTTWMTNPTGASFGSNRVLRGGCWGDNVFFNPVSIRTDMPPAGIDAFSCGFRIALSSDKKGKEEDFPLMENVPFMQQIPLF